MPAWYLYVARCGDGSLYTGIATDPRERIKHHNAGRGSAYVRSKRPAVLVYAARCKDRSQALRKEMQVKSWTRQRKLAWLKDRGCST